MSDINYKVKLEGAVFHIISMWNGPTTHVKMHTHSAASYELHYVYKGQGILRLQTGDYALKKESFYLTGPGIAHEQIPLEEDPMEELGMYYTAPLSWIEAARKKRSNCSSKERFYGESWMEQLLLQNFWLGELPEEIRRVMYMLEREIHGEHTGYQSLVPCLAGTLLILLGRLYHAEPQAGRTAYVPCSEESRYLQIERLFLNNPVQISTRTLAGELGLSVRQVQRLMKSHYGITFQQMHMNYKLDAACTLLKESNLSVAQIAEKLEFSSPDYFGHCFRRQYGMPPGRYRKVEKENPCMEGCQEPYKRTYTRE